MSAPRAESGADTGAESAAESAAVAMGRVVEFDPAVGLGVVEAEVGEAGEGGEGSRGRYPFHCTQISDGSRAIEVGAAVRFRVVAGRLGRWEAAGIGPRIK